MSVLPSFQNTRIKGNESACVNILVVIKLCWSSHFTPSDILTIYRPQYTVCIGRLRLSFALLITVSVWSHLLIHLAVAVKFRACIILFVHSERIISVFTVVLVQGSIHVGLVRASRWETSSLFLRTLSSLIKLLLLYYNRQVNQNGPTVDVLITVIFYAIISD